MNIIKHNDQNILCLCTENCRKNIVVIRQLGDVAMNVFVSGFGCLDREFFM